MRFKQFIFENIIEPNVEFFDKRIKLVRDFSKRNNKILDIIKFANRTFFEFNIEFKLDNMYTANTTKNGKIQLYLKPDFFVDFVYNFEEYANMIKELITHELIHREHANRVSKKFNKFSSIYDLGSDKYLAHKHEIMANAKQAIFELRSAHYRNKDIYDAINLGAPDGMIMSDYQNKFRNNRKVLNLFYKYIYMYLDPEDYFINKSRKRK